MILALYELIICGSISFCGVIDGNKVRHME